MKKILFAFAFTFAASAVTFAQTPAKKTANTATASTKTKTASFKWDKTTHDFGTIPQAKPTTAEFRFTNNGGAPLIIAAAQGSCGCTVADYTKEPIAPGKSGFVKATFNAASPGPFTKTVTVSSNAGTAPVVLNIKGEVKAKDNTAANQ